MGHLKANNLQLKRFSPTFPHLVTLGGQALIFLTYLPTSKPCRTVLDVHQPLDRMWLAASSIYTQQRPHMGQHRNADTAESFTRD